jgi:hypothetical protein
VQAALAAPSRCLRSSLSLARAPPMLSSQRSTTRTARTSESFILTKTRICKQADMDRNDCPNNICVRCGRVECEHCRESEAEALTGAVFVDDLCAECDYAVREQVRHA